MVFSDEVLIDQEFDSAEELLLTWVARRLTFSSNSIVVACGDDTNKLEPYISELLARGYLQEGQLRPHDSTTYCYWLTWHGIRAVLAGLSPTVAA